MKYLFLSLLSMIVFLNVDAQNDSLQQYTGTYKFPDGSVVSEVIVTLDSAGLVANSAMGSTVLKRTEGDVFEIVTYGGTATFKRNAENKVSGVLILVGDINLEGTKMEGLGRNGSYQSYWSYRSNGSYLSTVALAKGDWSYAIHP